MEAPTTGAAVADSPAAPDFRAYAQEADAADLRRDAPDTSDETADPSPAEPAAQAASTDAKRDAGSDPAAPPKGQRLKERLSDLEAEKARLHEELRTVKLLKQELAALRQPAADTTKPASAPAPHAQSTKAEWQRYRQHPDAPKVEDFESYEDFVAAQGLFIADRRYEERQQRERLEAESQQRVQSVQQKIDGFLGTLSKAREADPEFDAKVDPGLLSLVPAFALRSDEPVRPANVLLQEVITSEAAADLLVHFSTPEGQQEWAKAVSAETPADLLRAFGRIEARFLGGSRAEADKPAPKPVTKAPAPPTVLGRQPASPDRAAAALAKGDFRGYSAAADAEDLAKFRGRR